MKKIFILIFSIILITWNTFAYNFTKKELQSLKKLENKVIELEATKNINFLESKVTLLEKAQKKVKRNSKNWRILNEVKKYFRNSINNKLKKLEQESIVNTPKHDNYDFEMDFYNKYWKNIQTNTKIPDNCFKYFNILDVYWQRYNFPTPLIMATWSIETNCNMSNPANWYWLFQITSKHYTPWEIGVIELQDQVLDFINFSKAKWDYFNNNKYHNYKTRFWNENINITYNNYSLRDIRLHWILYNWVSANTTLEWNTFVNNNLNKDVVWNYDWLLTRLLKILYIKNRK